MGTGIEHLCRIGWVKRVLLGTGGNISRPEMLEDSFKPNDRGKTDGSEEIWVCFAGCVCNRGNDGA